MVFTFDLGEKKREMDWLLESSWEYHLNFTPQDPLSLSFILSWEPLAYMWIVILKNPILLL